MRKKERLQEAVLRMFPTEELYLDFIKDGGGNSKKIIENIIEQAYETGLIQECTEPALLKLINKKSILNPSQENLKLTFLEIIDSIAGEHSINSLVEWLNATAVNLGFAKIHASMITRLKKSYNPTTIKQNNFLRLLSFWVGLKKPILPYNFLTFKDISSKLEPVNTCVEDEGVRIDFSFEKSGEIIDYQMIEWLREEIKVCIIDLKLFHLTGIKLHTYSTTSITIEIPKKEGPSKEPLLFGKGIKDAIMMGHQIAVRWLLHNKNIKPNAVVVGISAGKFATLEIEMQNLMESIIPGDYSIRLTNFARLCARMADIKVLMKEVEVFTQPYNYLKNIWVVEYFWYYYFDFIPYLLSEEMLPRTSETFDEFKLSLNFPDTALNDSKHKALLLIRKLPQNALLLMEIAKVLAARRMYHEANIILSVVLAENPGHVVARAYKMLLLVSLGMQQDETEIFDLFFAMAVEESELILKQYPNDEDICCEVGAMFLSKAIYLINKSKSLQYSEQISEAFNQAEKHFFKGLVHSKSKTRSIFWVLHLKSICSYVKLQQNSFSSTKNLNDISSIYKKTGLKMFRFLGWITSDVSISECSCSENDLEMLEKHMFYAINTFSNSVNQRILRPNVSYCFASFVWDFAPVITVGIAKLVLSWLQEAAKLAEDLIAEDLGVYSIISYYSCIQNPKHFIACIDKTIHLINEIIADDLTMSDDHIIDPERTNKLKLLPLHFFEKIDSLPIVCKSGVEKKVTTEIAV